MEPCQGKQSLGPDGRVALLHVVLGPRLVGPLEVPFDAGRSLVGDFETGLEEDGRKLGVGLCGQPQSEPLVGLQTVQLLFQRW